MGLLCRGPSSTVGLLHRLMALFRLLREVRREPAVERAAPPPPLLAQLLAALLQPLPPLVSVPTGCSTRRSSIFGLLVCCCSQDRPGWGATGPLCLLAACPAAPLSTREFRSDSPTENELVRGAAHLQDNMEEYRLV